MVYVRRGLGSGSKIAQRENWEDRPKGSALAHTMIDRVWFPHSWISPQTRMLGSVQMSPRSKDQIGQLACRGVHRCRILDPNLLDFWFFKKIFKELLVCLTGFPLFPQSKFQSSQLVELTQVQIVVLSVAPGSGSWMWDPEVCGWLVQSWKMPLKALRVIGADFYSNLLMARFSFPLGIFNLFILFSLSNWQFFSFFPFFILFFISQFFLFPFFVMV